MIEGSKIDLKLEVAYPQKLPSTHNTYYQLINIVLKGPGVTFTYAIQSDSKEACIKPGIHTFIWSESEDFPPL